MQGTSGSCPCLWHRTGHRGWRFHGVAEPCANFCRTASRKNKWLRRSQEQPFTSHEWARLYSRKIMSVKQKVPPNPVSLNFFTPCRRSSCTQRKNPSAPALLQSLPMLAYAAFKTGSFLPCAKVRGGRASVSRCPSKFPQGDGTLPGLPENLGLRPGRTFRGLGRVSTLL